MEGYFNIKVKFVLAILLAVGLYVVYLYHFQAQTPDPFRLKENCTTADEAQGTRKANAFFERYFDAKIAMDPERQGELGLKTNQDQWTPINKAFYEAQYAFNEGMLQYLKDSVIRCECLDEPTQLSAKLLKRQLELDLESEAFRYHDYPVNQMFGVPTSMPSFLINVHQIENDSDALNYIARVDATQYKIADLIEALKLREAKNIILPKFLFPKVLESVENLMRGFPLDAKSSEQQVLFKDFTSKVNALGLPKTRTALLMTDFKMALKTSFQPAYQKLYNYLKELEAKATNDAGVWKFSDGEAFYAFKLREQTSTALSPEEIYQLGLDEVQRIQSEMQAIMKTVDFEGSLQDFFEFMRDDPQFYYSNNAKGKAAYLADATAIIDQMRPKLEELFARQPKAELRVKAVEEFREKSAGKAFYQAPAPDGSRPGIYYANTYNMADMPKYQMEALAYHEAIPGHHMQLSLAQELDNLPRFRRLEGNYTAYIEGWGLYSEYLPKEIGFYQDPYSDFGRLAMELWRACRLVVDVGIHYHKWDRQKALAYYQNNTPNAKGDCVKMVERHMVMPGQATTYKIGMITILELKAKAQKEMGDRFDIRAFHGVLLNNGAVPLDVLEDLVDEYIQG